MSTLKVGAINNPSASSGGLAISATGNVTGAGLDLIATQTFSAASSVSLNNCFTATYDNYCVLLSGTSSAGNNIDFRLRVGGVDASGSNYVRRYITSGSAGTSVTSGTLTTTAGTFCSPNASSPYDFNAIATVVAPAQAAATNVVSLGFASYNLIDNLRHTLATAYDGFTILPTSSTITGTVSVYGYKK